MKRERSILVGGAANVDENWRFENPLQMGPGNGKPAEGARWFGCVGCVA
jgi:hypothetical protein